jgi:hypothetical protein
MLKHQRMLLGSLLFVFYVDQCVAISPGAGQAQIRANTQQLEQHKKWVEQQRKKQEMIQQQKIQPQSLPRVTPRVQP